MAANNPKYLIVHCSVSKWGSVADIDEWHRQRGFVRCGYHDVILNQYPDYRDLKDQKPRDAVDGTIEPGRPYSMQGAHCLGYNAQSIGICLIGADGKFTVKQMTALERHCRNLMARYNIPVSHVLGHCETASGKAEGKTCPEFSVADLRARLDA